MPRLEDRVALVTGGARGQGEAIARLFVEEGARVVIADVLDEAGAKLAVDLGDSARFVHLDVANEQDWQKAVEATIAAFGKLDALVNNAGILHFAPMDETTADQFRRVVEVNE